MTKRIAWVGLCLVLLLLGGCASAPAPIVTPTKQLLAAVKTIDIVMPPEASYFLVRSGNEGLAALGGAVGAALGEGMQGDRAKFVQMTQTHKFAPYKALADRTLEKLTALGYSVRLINAPWEIK